jgi:hypothetical protein
MDSSKPLILDNGGELNAYPKDPKNLLYKIIALYGKTNSGKSYMIDELMRICKDYTPALLIVNPTSEGKNIYEGKVPNRCVKFFVKSDWIVNVNEKQKNRAMIYDKANKLNTMEEVFNLVASTEEKTKIENINARADLYVQKANSNTKLSKKEIKEAIAKIRNSQNDSLRKIYKGCIRSNLNLLRSKINNGLIKSENHICAINYVNYNPNFILILDDCAQYLKEWYIEQRTMFKEMFFRCRQYYLTLILTSQSDKELESELRSNVTLTIYTDPQAASMNFKRTSDSYPSHVRKMADLAIKGVFSSNREGVNHKKLVYDKKKNEGPSLGFYYLEADSYDDYRITCSALWELDERTKESNESKHDSAIDNPFFKEYYIL